MVGDSDGCDLMDLYLSPRQIAKYSAMAVVTGHQAVMVQGITKLPHATCSLHPVCLKSGSSWLSE